MTGTFMAAEIAETGQALRRQLDANLEATARLADELRAGEPAFVVTIARGSSDHAAAFLKHAVELKLGLACASLGPSIASLYEAPLRLDRAVAITISQSGRSPDIVAMQRAAKAAGATTIALVNVADSPAATDADAFLPLLAGEERSVAATKSMIASMVAGAALVAHWSGDADLAAAIERLPAILDAVRTPAPAEIEDMLATENSLFVIGRGATFAVAMEAALKLKETSAIYAEAFSSAEVLHGPAGVITPGFPVLGFAPAPADAARDGFFETVERLASFGAAPLIVDVERHARWPSLVAPDAGHPMVTPIAALNAFYGIAEATARRRGRNPDEPPHLMKVTRTM
jgi:glucosamine--fructose-6-phosphate aminotransferase (isomerizing)